MDTIILQGGKALAGEVTVSGAKNAALPVLISSLLTEEACVYEEIPHLTDIRTTLELLSGVGERVESGRWFDGAAELELQANRI